MTYSASSSMHQSMFAVLKGAVLDPRQTTLNLNGDFQSGHMLKRLVIANVVVGTVWAALYFALRKSAVLPEFTPPNQISYGLAFALYSVIGGAWFPLVGFFIRRWLWNGPFGYGGHIQSVNAALAMSYAFALLIMIPGSLIATLADAGLWGLPSSIGMIPVTVSGLMTAFYFAVALGIGFWKAWFFNAASMLAVFAGFGLFGLLYFRLLVPIVVSVLR